MKYNFYPFFSLAGFFYNLRKIGCGVLGMLHIVMGGIWGRRRRGFAEYRYRVARLNNRKELRLHQG